MIKSLPSPPLEPTMFVDEHMLRIDQATENKRQQFLERNRIAASKCRKKKKQWIDRLQRELDDEIARNKELLAEVDGLKEQLDYLKSLKCSCST